MGITTYSYYEVEWIETDPCFGRIAWDDVYLVNSPDDRYPFLRHWILLHDCHVSDRSDRYHSYNEVSRLDDEADET
jgi:hypothetical protein